MKKNIDYKNNKGITLIALVLTVVISLLLIATVAATFDNISETRDYHKKKQDIIALSKAVQSYYLQEEKLPLKDGKIIVANDFYRTITDYRSGIDRNPNDNDRYYVLYSPTYKDTINEYLTEVNIRSEDSTYIINEKSLTVYCRNPFTIDGEDHYTASEDFSGGTFASQHYEELGIIDDPDLKINIDTGTVINVNGVDTPYSTYASKDSIIKLTLDISDSKFYNENGEEIANITFNDFEGIPKTDSFLITITSLDGVTTYLENATATNVTMSGPYCVFEFDLSKYGLNIDDMVNRRRITYSYNKESDIYYNIENRMDYDYMLTNYLKLHSFEFENNDEEIILASEMNKSTSPQNLAANIKNIQTKDASGALKNWTDNTSYTTIITAPSTQKYVINDNDPTNFIKAYQLKLKHKSTVDNVPIGKRTVEYYVNGIQIYKKSSSKATSYITLAFVPGTEIKTITKVSGFTSKSWTWTMKETNKAQTLEITPKVYKFTLASQTPGSAVTLSNTSHSFSASGDANTQTRVVEAYIGDIINYNVQKDYYRFNQTIANGSTCNEIANASSTKAYTMKAKNITENVTLARNINSETLSISDKASGVKESGSWSGEKYLTNSKVVNIDINYKIYSSATTSSSINFYYTKNGSEINGYSETKWSDSDLDPESGNQTIYTASKYPPTDNENQVSRIRYRIDWRATNKFLGATIPANHHVSSLKMTSYYAAQ